MSPSSSSSSSSSSFSSSKPSIHPTSQVHPSALSLIHSSVTIGPFCLVGPNVSIGPGTVLLSHVIVSGRTTIGSNCTIHPHAVLGGSSQAIADNDKDDAGRLTIGDRCTIRESVTANLGLHSASGTVIGNDCLLMANSHVAHDCVIENEVILTNGVLLAGHVTVKRGAILAGMVGVVQFVTVGELAYVGGATVVSRDVLPFSMVKGFRGLTVGVNVVGLRRRKLGEERIKTVERAVGMILSGDEDGVRRLMEKEKEKQEQEQGQEQVTGTESEGDVKRLVEFVKKSKRGVCLGEIRGKGVAKI